MFWLWLIVFGLLFAISMYILGRLEGGNEDDKVTFSGVAFICSLLWPIVLTAIIIFGPFIGLYALGERHRNQRNEKKAK